MPPTRATALSAGQTTSTTVRVPRFHATPVATSGSTGSCTVATVLSTNPSIRARRTACAGLIGAVMPAALLLATCVALNLRDGNVHSGVNHADVKDCYLFAPIDVQPGTSPNKVPIGHGQVSVAVLATGTMRADHLLPKTFRFGQIGRAHV